MVGGGSETAGRSMELFQRETQRGLLSIYASSLLWAFNPRHPNLIRSPPPERVFTSAKVLHAAIALHILAAMEAPHKAHHKPSAGAKHAKKDAAKGVDRSGGKNFNPKVRT